MSDYKKLSIKNWAVEDRPREKLLQKGRSTLSNAELLAILLGSGNREETAVELAQRILNSAENNLNELGKLSVTDLTKVKGVGPAKALTIIAATELGRRRKSEEVLNKNKITGSKDVADIFSSMLSDFNHEEFWILILNRSNKIIDRIKISQGGISGTVIDVRLIMKHAIEKAASSLIICHNHPSGNTLPSEADKRITTKIKEAGLLMDINLLDHIIVSEKSYYSFADEGIL